MTEDQWLTCGEPAPMLDWVAAAAAERKLRLFACACCRRIWNLIVDARARTAVEAAERFADGALTRRLLDEQWDAEGVSAAEHAVDGATANDIRWGAFWAAANATEAVVARDLARITRPPVPLTRDEFRKWAESRSAVKEESDRTEKTAQANLLRDIIGNPFHPAGFDSTWRTPTTLRLAQAIYDERCFDRMPELADELQRAGCQDLALLDHCRKVREHVRGCWALDLVLGKS
jgi:hypothetical protein